MKIKYSRYTFSVDFFDKLRIEYLKALLFLKRQKRRMAVMLTKQDLYLYILITLLWIGFAIFILFAILITCAGVSFASSDLDTSYMDDSDIDDYIDGDLDDGLDDEGDDSDDDWYDDSDDYSDDDWDDDSDDDPDYDLDDDLDDDSDDDLDDMEDDDR